MPRRARSKESSGAQRDRRNQGLAPRRVKSRDVKAYARQLMVEEEQSFAGGSNLQGAMAQQARRSNDQDARALVVQPPRLPMPREAAPAGVAPGQWKALVDAVFPSAKTVDGVMLAITYCKERNLDIFKRPVHVVPMWNSALGREVETVWPGINDYRTTASRTGQWAGNDECKFGPMLTEAFKDEQERNAVKCARKFAKAECPAFSFPNGPRSRSTRSWAASASRSSDRRSISRRYSPARRVFASRTRGGARPDPDAREMRRSSSSTPRIPGRARQRLHRRGNGREGLRRRSHRRSPRSVGAVAATRGPKPTRESVRGWSDEVEAELSASGIRSTIRHPPSSGLSRPRSTWYAEFNAKTGLRQRSRSSSVASTPQSLNWAAAKRRTKTKTRRKRMSRRLIEEVKSAGGELGSNAAASGP
jgi:hypothetical protein